MNNDDFDTYVSSKGFSFNKEENEPKVYGLSYVLGNKDRQSYNEKFITLYQKFYDYKFALHYNTFDRNEYLRIKNQIKSLGFVLSKSEAYSDKGNSVNHFVYTKGNSEILLFVYPDGYEIDFGIKDNSIYN